MIVEELKHQRIYRISIYNTLIMPLEGLDSKSI